MLKSLIGADGGEDIVPHYVPTPLFEAPFTETQLR